MNFKHNIDIELSYEKGQEVYYIDWEPPTIFKKPKYIVYKGYITFWKIEVYPDCEHYVAYFVSNKKDHHGDGWREREPDKIFNTEEEAQKALKNEYTIFGL